ncbi:hypothetical protein MPSI1_002336 [Malassezia psittaci]|uniref:Uncharacterized protein n=1 Tax=Malassezia psittaci TaxID=1821823 RepID=A0AAF0FFI6_9BASI|nr:hypothetical protein MPSI1_002336 [Malassezia psittaci]
MASKSRMPQLGSMYAQQLVVRSYASKPRQGVVNYAMKLMSDPVIETISLASRIARILVGSVLVVGSMTFVVWEGAHQYVEHAAMPSTATVDLDTTYDPYGWDLEDQLHHFGLVSHTDRRLGIFGRHMVRSAWMAEHWGGGIAPQAIFGLAPRGSTMRQTPDLEAHHGLQLAERFLSTSLHIADAKKIRVEELNLEDKPLDWTAVTLEAWLANLRTKIATPATLAAAEVGYEKLYDALHAQPHTEPFCKILATRIGTVQAQLGQLSQGISWFQRALDKEPSDVINAALADTYMPSSPLDTRLAVHTLQTLSRGYVLASSQSEAPRAQLYEALRAQLAALHLLRTEQKRIAQSPDATLQQAWTLEAQGEMSVQVAETLYALQQHPAKHNLLTWWKRDKLLNAVPQTFGALQTTSKIGRMQMSQAWLQFASERALSAKAQLSANNSPQAQLSPSHRHASERILRAANLVEEETQLLIRSLEKLQS